MRFETMAALDRWWRSVPPADRRRHGATYNAEKGRLRSARPAAAPPIAVTPATLPAWLARRRVHAWHCLERRDGWEIVVEEVVGEGPGAERAASSYDHRIEGDLLLRRHVFRG
jgi:hypothetical protein